MPTSSSLGRWLVLAPAAVVGAALVLSRLAPDGVLAFAHCPLRDLIGMPCPTCGGTHALVALSRGDVGAAWRWNPVVPVGALLLLGWAAWAVAASALPPLRVRPALGPRETRAARWLAAAVLLGLWLRQILTLR